MDTIYTALEDCDLFVSIGTSGKVYPAAGFAQVAKSCGARTIELNLEATTGIFDASFNGLAGDIVPPFVDELLRR